jgi:cupin fold WbuC family metalloprotein
MRSIIKIDSSFVFENLINFRSKLLSKNLLPLTQEFDKLQVSLNFLKRGARVLPHQHLIVPKDELILIVDGAITVSIFNEDKELFEQISLHKNAHLFTVIPGGVYHAVDVDSEEAIILQVINGPYNTSTHKEFMN